MEKAGVRYENVANQFDCSKLSGRLRGTKERQDGHIRLIHLRNQYIFATITAAQTLGRHHPRISAQTFRNRLNEANLRRSDWRRRVYRRSNVILTHACMGDIDSMGWSNNVSWNHTLWCTYSKAALYF